MDELRVTKNGAIEPAAMKTYGWQDDRTLEIDIRQDQCFPDGGS